MSGPRRCAIVAALLLAGLGALPGTASAADRAFAQRFQTHTRGNIAMAANSLLTCPGSAPTCASARAGTGTASDLANNGWVMTNVDVDADPSTFNSSSAGLSIPAGATVKFAGLYWGADSSAGAGGAAAPAPGFENAVLLKSPGAAAYTPVIGSLDWSTSWPTRYAGFADVTAQVAAGGAGSYTVANVQAGTGNDRYGGWSLVVAYQSPGEPVRDLSVYDGLVTVATGATDTVTLNGIETPPSGTVHGNLDVVSWESELGISGDGAKLEGSTLSDAANPATNFFNSSISAGGAAVTSKSPNYANQLGFDADTVGVDGLIAPGSTSATLQLSSTGDTYFAGVVALATDRPAEPPTNGGSPSLSGTLEDGRTLSADPGAWSGTQDISYAYQWQRCDAGGANCTDIPGATSATYDAGASDVGHTLQVVVTATNSEGTATAASGASSVVQPQPPSVTSPPTVGGGSHAGDTLSAGAGEWSGTGPVTPSYQWQRCDAEGNNCTNIPGATGPTYQLTPADVGHTIVVVETGSNGAGSASSPSSPTPVVAPAPATPHHGGQTGGGGQVAGGGAKPHGQQPEPDLDLGSLGWSRLTGQGCLRTSGARVLTFHVPGAGRLRIRVAPNGTLSQRRPLRARALVGARGRRILQHNLRRVTYRLGGRRLRSTARAPYRLVVSPARLAPHPRQTLVVRVVPRRGKARVAKLTLTTSACPDLFSVIHRPSRRGSLLGLRVDTRKALHSVTFRLPARLLASRRARGWAGAIRLGVSGRRPMNWRLAFPRVRAAGRTTVLTAAVGAPTVTVGRSTVTVTGLPARTGIVQLKLRGHAMRRTPRAVLRALLHTDAGTRRLTQRFRSKPA